MPIWRDWMDDPGDEDGPFQEPGAPIPQERDYARYVWIGQRLLHIRKRNRAAMQPTWDLMCKRWRETWR